VRSQDARALNALAPIHAQLCNDKVVGDGTINSLDIAALMYAQFGADPYFDTWSDPPLELHRFRARARTARKAEL